MPQFVLPLLMGRAPEAAQGAEAAAGGAAGLMQFLPFVLIFVIIYFLMIRPNNKRQKETQRMLENLKRGDRVVTIGGVHGTIHTVKEGGTVILKVDDTTKMEFSRNAIASVETSKASDAAEKTGKAVALEKADPAETPKKNEPPEKAEQTEKPEEGAAV